MSNKGEHSTQRDKERVKTGTGTGTGTRQLAATRQLKAMMHIRMLAHACRPSQFWRRPSLCERSPIVDGQKLRHGPTPGRGKSFSDEHVNIGMHGWSQKG